ncbi:hypothetical protein ABZ154_27440 [Streptomyces sp. NPDC006261]|uniref:hypothetical protein n=1 Tax=Streptomyces sp. NPDC006261 TaxID=3156739 RepID=UPI0033BF49FA
MRRTRAHRRAAALAAAAAVPLLGGCGIQETDPVEAGGPATVEAFYNRNDDMMLFFRTPDGGLNPVLRTVRPSAGFGGDYVGSGPDTAPGPPPTEKTVMALLAGPGQEDRAAGLTTALPAARPGTAVTVETAPGGTVTTNLPFPLKELNTTALRQLTCTIAYSQAADGKVVVKLTGQDGASSSDTCLP